MELITNLSWRRLVFADILRDFCCTGFPLLDDEFLLFDNVVVDFGDFSRGSKCTEAEEENIASIREIYENFRNFL